MRGLAHPGPRARSGATALAAAVDQPIAGVAPSAILLVRRLEATLSRQDTRASWDGRVGDVLARAARGAARPQGLRIPVDAAVVLFADWAEALACLAWALQARSGLGAWYWRALLGGEPSWWRFGRAIEERPHAVGAAMRELARASELVAVVREMPPRVARAVAAALREEVEARGLAPMSMSMSMSMSMHGGRGGAHAVAAEGPRARSVSAIPGLAAEGWDVIHLAEALVGRGTRTSRAAAAPPPSATGAEVVAARSTEVGETGAQADARATTPVARRAQQGAPARSSVDRGAMADAPRSSAREGPGDDAREPARAEIRPVVAELPAAVTRDPVADEEVPPPPLSAISRAQRDDAPSSSPAAPSLPLEVAAEPRPPAAPTPPGVHATEPIGADVEAPPIHLDVALHTQLGGTFYLINALTRFELFAYAPLAPWSLFEQLARALLPPEHQLDPLWAVVAALAEETAWPEARAGRWPPWMDTASERPRDHEDWMEQVSSALTERLQAALRELPLVTALVCPARVYLTRTHVDVVFRLDDIRLPVRVAGLDRDPGWVPALRRVVSFTYG